MDRRKEYAEIKRQIKSKKTIDAIKERHDMKHAIVGILE